jgi:hypothetical protein
VQTLAPTAVVLGNLSGSYADLDDSPDSPDGNWCTRLGYSPVTVTPLVGTARLIGNVPSLSMAGSWTVTPSVGTLRTVGRTPTVDDGTGPTVLVSVSFASAPSSTNNGGVYTGSVGSATLDLNSISGTPFEHVTDGGWTSGGAARFNADNAGGGIYRGLTLGYAGSPAQINVRYLAKWNNAYATGQFGNQKGDFFANGGTNFWSQQNAPSGTYGRKQMMLTYNSTLYIIHGNGQSCATIGGAGYEGALCNGSDTGLGDDAAAGPFEYDEWIDEWVCLEYQISSGHFSIYITTQDRTYDGLYMWSDQNPTGTPSIVGVSGMYYIESPTSGASIMMDELVVADGYIGPPAGF